MKVGRIRLDRALVPLVGVGALAATAWLLGRSSSSGVPRGVALALLTVAAAAIAFVGITRWRVGLYCFLTWLVFEDLPRKFLGNDMVVYFGKDILVAAVYLGFLLEWRRGGLRRFRPPFFLPLLFFAALCVVEVFNPNSPSLLYGLLGLKLYLYYVPLMFVGYALIDTERDLLRFLAFNLVLASIVAAIGVLQAVVSPGILNPATIPAGLNLLHLVRRAPLTGQLVPRATSVFVSDGRFGSYMLMTLFLALGMAAYTAGRRVRHRWMVVSCLALLLLAIALIGSRAGLLYTLGSILVFVSALVWRSRGNLPVRKALGRAVGYIALAAGATILVATVVFPQAVGARWAFYYQTIAPWSPASELVYRAQQYPVSEFLKAFTFPHWPIGYGIGTVSLGIQYLTATFNLPAPGVAVESGYGALILEMGVPGLLAWLAWTTAVTLASWKALRTLRDSALFAIGFSVFWFVFVLLFPLTYGGLAPYENFIFNAYFWLLVGVLFALPRLHGREGVALAGPTVHEPS